MSFYIRKYSGEKQRFDLDKFRRSLFKAGASQEIANTIIEQVERVRPKSTKQLHDITIQFLQKHALPIADRYNLKRALMEFGPHGFPFEKFVAHIFAAQGYDVKTGVIISGFCVDHEVDVVASKNNDHFMAECKFHNRPGIKSDVKVSLYVQARFEDIRARDENKNIRQAWLVTNTKLTSEAMKYGECKNIQLLSWSYPDTNNLPHLIGKYNLFPITTLTSLNRYQKGLLLQNGLVLCKDMQTERATLEKTGLKPHEIDNIVQESLAVCKIKTTD